MLIRCLQVRSMARNATFACLCFALLALAGCGSKMQAPPVGIGRGIEDLKQSPCACREIPMHRPSWAA